ncbi:hypothetical protein BZG11_13945 [Salinivibrio kushneri]|nr:hypothetical protein BZG11_13945 [Salinivibrio kushneri]OOE50623.1 hypothetical protein BZG10_08410 [Salinivibrio kushneri]
MMHYATWAPVTFGANFNTGANFDLNVRWRRATGARRKSHQACAIEKALMPTYAWFIYWQCRLLVPTLLRGNAYGI